MYWPMGYFRAVPVQAGLKMWVVPYGPSCWDSRHDTALVFVSCRHGSKYFISCRALSRAKWSYRGPPKIGTAQVPALPRTPRRKVHNYDFKKKNHVFSLFINCMCLFLCPGLTSCRRWTCSWRLTTADPKLEPPTVTVNTVLFKEYDTIYIISSNFGDRMTI